MTKQFLHELEEVDITGCLRCKHFGKMPLFQLCQHPSSSYGVMEFHTCQHMRSSVGGCGSDRRLRNELT